eukprot:Mrub_02549.p3 GENE.Mrub_02549~~Mrub_02549.p3  ORF type:complete len:146 (+),score=44.02 Mrub_02549:788-1225(+)
MNLRISLSNRSRIIIYKNRIRTKLQKFEEFKYTNKNNKNRVRAQTLSIALIKYKELNNVAFEKDDDSNHHIAWIHFTSLLRCRNYGTKTCTQFKTKLIAFEKDDDSNHHIAWIHFTSLLRCRNYGIKTCTQFKTKLFFVVNGYLV